jgi:hypothetical protein
MKWSILTFLLVFQIAGFSQQLAAFNDHLRHFWVFDGGNFTQLEHLEIQEFQVGGILVAYIDNGDNLKVYQNGTVETLMTGAPIKFTATDYLLGFSIYQQLNVYENGKNKILSTQCGGYIVMDSLIVWYDQIIQSINVYYGGKTFTIESGLLFDPVKEFKLSSNMAIYYQSFQNQLKLFYGGEIYILDDYVEDAVFEAGRDIAAFIDIPDQTFKVFYRGEIIELEAFMPRSFMAGNESIAYVDNLGKLKYFVNGELIEISNYEPGFYELTDNVLVFEEQGSFKTVCNGQPYVIERYIPSLYRMDNNTIIYYDQNQFLKGFYACEPIILSYEKVKEINVIRDLVIFVTGVHNTNIYFLGQIFEH